MSKKEKNELSSEEWFEKRDKELGYLVMDCPPCAGPLSTFTMLKWFDAAEKKLKGATSLGSFGFRILPRFLLKQTVAKNMPEQPDATRIADYWLNLLDKIGVARPLDIQVVDCFGTYACSGVAIVESRCPFPDDWKEEETIKTYNQYYSFDEVIDCLRAQDGLNDFSIQRFSYQVPADEQQQGLSATQRIVQNPAVWDIIQYLTLRLYLKHFHWSTNRSVDCAQWISTDMWVLYSLLCQELNWRVERVPSEITDRWVSMVNALGESDVIYGSPRMLCPGMRFFQMLSELRDLLRTKYTIRFYD